MRINPQDLRIEVSDYTHLGMRVGSKIVITHIPTGESATLQGNLGHWRLRELAFSMLKKQLDAYPEQLELFE